MASLSQRNSIFSGILLLLLAGVLAMVGILWGSFIDFTTPKGVQEVFAGLSSSPAPRLTGGFGNWRELPICYTIPQGDLFRFFELVSPRLQAIASRMAFRAKIDIALDSADVVYRVSTGKAIMGAVSAVAYAKLRRQYPIIAVFERAGRVPKTSLFVVRAEDTATSFADLRGKRICFRAKDSMSGYYIPLQELKAAGIDSETFFSQISYNDNLANSTLGLISGEFDVILLSNTFYEELPPEQRQKLRVLYASKPIPGGVYISTATASAQLQTFFAEFQAYGETVAATAPLAGLFQVKPADPAAYDVLEGASIDDE